MAKQVANYGRRWYAIHTYSGYEENVADNVKQRIDTLHMQDYIFGVLVPKEKVVKIKNGKRRATEEKIYPGYVLVGDSNHRFGHIWAASFL
jgi:transcriptional antiterminator NusG